MLLLDTIESPAPSVTSVLQQENQPTAEHRDHVQGAVRVQVGLTSASPRGRAR